MPRVVVWRATAEERAQRGFILFGQRAAPRRPGRAPQVAARLKGKVEQNAYLSVFTLGEVDRGIARREARDPAVAADLPGRLYLPRRCGLGTRRT